MRGEKAYVASVLVGGTQPLTGQSTASQLMSLCSVPPASVMIPHAEVQDTGGSKSPGEVSPPRSQGTGT